VQRITDKTQVRGIMPKININVSHEEFPSRQEYEAALRDQRIIKDLMNEYDVNKKADIDRLYAILQSGKIRFESSLGNHFDDEIYELHMHPVNLTTNTKKPLANRTSKNKKKKSVAKNTVKLEYFDPLMQENIRKEMKKAERKRRFLIILFSAVGVLCIGYVVIYQYYSSKSERRWEALSNLVGSEALTSTNTDSGIIVHLEETEYEVPDILAKYQTLYNSNQRLIGWLKIDDTIIDYPVMQCSDNTYYLEHNFDQEEDKAGALFLDYNCNVITGCDNYIIYGHHLMSGKMFSSLTEYESENYYVLHPYISFDTIYEEADYQVMYVFRSRVFNEDEVCFKYYQFINANSEEEFLSYMNEMAQLSFYDTGVNAVYGDQLLTLSTCDYNEPNGRFVVVAKRIN